MPSITTRDGVTLHYRDEGRGLPVLLMHAFSVTSTMFEPQVAALASKYRFITPDCRGFGESGDGRGPTLMSTIAGDMLELLDALHLETAVIGGVSLGGFATMEVLRRAPHRARAVLLMNTTMGAPDAAAIAERVAWAEQTEARGVSVIVEAFVPRMLSPLASPELRARVARMIERNRPSGLVAALRGIVARGDSTDVLASYAGPALVLYGELDPGANAAKARLMAEQLKNATLAGIPDAGHLANLEAPEPVTRTLDDFLSKLAP